MFNRTHCGERRYGELLNQALRISTGVPEHLGGLATPHKLRKNFRVQGGIFQEKLFSICYKGYSPLYIIKIFHSSQSYLLQEALDN